ncbi:MAG: DUF488 family protein [Alphaproteobacteria bacterium]|nr:DUF488 family protein [Alphaproteobacteria bacterium]
MTDFDILTVGHSNQSYEAFARLLKGAGATAVADVRTQPYSRRNPQFNREKLRDALRADGIEYVHLGDTLGGRPRGTGGAPDYEALAAAPEFSAGLDRLMEGARRYRVAVMCAERDPKDCHRCLLVSRALETRGVSVGHILGDGSLIAHARIEDELVAAAGETNLFETPAERLARAYRRQATGEK